MIDYESMIIFIVFVIGAIIIMVDFIVEELEKEISIKDGPTYIVKRKYINCIENDYKYFSYLDRDTYYSGILEVLYTKGLIKKKESK